MPVLRCWSWIAFNSGHGQKDGSHLGKEVTYVRYKAEGRGFAKVANQIDCLNRVIAWFNDHLKKQDA